MKYLFIILLLSSCGQSFHLKKFYKKGGKIEPIEKTITITDTIQGADGKDSIVFRDVIIDCPDPVIETKWQTRIKYKFDNKRFKDSLKHYLTLDKFHRRNDLKTHRIDAKTEIKKDKQETKRVKAKYNLWMILLGLVLGIILHMIILKVKSK
jgi:hypothetical protein